MYEWIKGYNLVEYSGQAERMDFGGHESFHMERLELESPPVGMTAAAQYFIAQQAWLSDDFQQMIPADNANIRELILAEVAPHFTDVKQVIREGNIETIYLQELKPESRQLFVDTHTGILPVLEDLYRHHDIRDSFSGVKRKIVNYVVDPAALEPYETPGTETLQALLNAYLELPDGEYALMPLGWKFDDHLQNSSALRFFAGWAPHLMLGVDADTDEVIILHMSGKEFTREVLLNSARPKPPRRRGSYLYVDTGHALVNVIDLSRQSHIKAWNELKDVKVYQLPEGMDFTDFNHETAEPLPAGIAFLYDQDSLQSMIGRVNQELEDFGGP
ncbi:hypothetical protein [Paenibacillus sonchi]|uniref:hypothetical protein n=1 Tax=Paenibacillus sonchi TaxID=373687 RepID=UPI001E61809B|nr:hypothetical protein [Paenibacillus sonchi]MCE3200155.1 hypothetical protein [Paenibacillus sonchi]